MSRICRALLYVGVLVTVPVGARVQNHHARWNVRMLTVQTDLVGSRPAGQTRGGAPRVRAAVSATRAWGLPISLDAGATDANDPMSPSIPAITSDGGGHGTDGHALGGTFDSFNSWQGAQRALLIALALAQL